VFAVSLSRGYDALNLSIYDILWGQTCIDLVEDRAGWRR
jgi:hypothetical protein